MTKAGQGPILGISADFHDSAAALVVDGQIVAAAQEERFTRIKHDPSLPINAMRWCLDHAEIGRDDLEAVVFHGKPFTTYERIVRTHARVGPRGFPVFSKALKTWTGSKLWVGYRMEAALQDMGRQTRTVAFAEHHMGHAASAFYPSPFESAAVVTFDGVGEWATTSVGHGVGGDLKLLGEVNYPNSIGLLYAMVTVHCGFAVNDGESKVMGLAPYGRPTYLEAMKENLIEVAPDGAFGLRSQWFDFDAGSRMAAKRTDALFDGPARQPNAPISQREADLACSVQTVLEDMVLQVARHAKEQSGENNLCLAGGVALNCVANSVLRERGPFDDVWVQPAAGDAGGAIGAALWYHHALAEAPRSLPLADGMGGCALGPEFSSSEIAAWLDQAGVAFNRHPKDHFELTARAIANGAVVGWFQGRMEFGPRALGNRSILADPRTPESVRKINARVKKREGFRPLAPAVLAAHQGDIFDTTHPSPHMLFTAKVRDAIAITDLDVDEVEGDLARVLGSTPSPIPACTHIDGSARVQTVTEQGSPALHGLLSAFHALTDCPVLVNTSFNRADEPIVRSPADALRCAAAAHLDLLVMGDCVIQAEELHRLAQVPGFSRRKGPNQ